MSEIGPEELKETEQDPGGPAGDGRPVEEKAQEGFDPEHDEDIPDEDTVESVGY